MCDKILVIIHKGFSNDKKSHVDSNCQMCNWQSCLEKQIFRCWKEALHRLSMHKHISHDSCYYDLSIKHVDKSMSMERAWAIGWSENGVKLSPASTNALERSCCLDDNCTPRIEQYTILKHLQTTICFKQDFRNVSVEMWCWIAIKHYKWDFSIVWKLSYYVHPTPSSLNLNLNLGPVLWCFSSIITYFTSSWFYSSMDPTTSRMHDEWNLKCFHTRKKCAIRMIILVTIILMMVFWPMCTQIILTKVFQWRISQMTQQITVWMPWPLNCDLGGRSMWFSNHFRQ